MSYERDGMGDAMTAAETAAFQTRLRSWTDGQIETSIGLSVRCVDEQRQMASEARARNQEPLARMREATGTECRDRLALARAEQARRRADAMRLTEAPQTRTSRQRITPALAMKFAVAGLAGWYAYKKTDGNIVPTAAAAGAGFFLVPPIAKGIGYAFSPSRPLPDSVEEAWHRFEAGARPQWLTPEWRLRSF